MRVERRERFDIRAARDRAPGEALATRAVAGVDRVALAKAALPAPRAGTRNAGRALLLALDPDDGTEALLAAAMSAPEVGERQAAWSQLASLRSDRVDVAITSALDAWRDGRGDASSAIEVFEAALARGGTDGARANVWLAPSPQGDAADLVARAVDDGLREWQAHRKE